MTASAEPTVTNGMLETLHPSQRELLRFFEVEHLPEQLKDVSRPFSILARSLVASSENEVTELDEASVLSTTLGLLASARLDGAELTTALRKLLEAKDCAVRAALD